MGFVVNGGFDVICIFIGWRFKDSGSGNMNNFLMGFIYLIGNFQIVFNFMWQKFLVDFIFGDVSGLGWFRNILDDFFVVRDGNWEIIVGELLIMFDFMLGIWMYDWDSDCLEDVKFVMSVGFVYCYLFIFMDVVIGFLGNCIFFVFFGVVFVQDFWEFNIWMVLKVNLDLGFIVNILFGIVQVNGDSDWLFECYVMDLWAIYKKYKFVFQFKVNDWGFFDYYWDFNFIYLL